MNTFSYRFETALYPTNDICLLTASPQDKNNILNFSAGQYVEAKCSNGIWLPLSIANAPQPNGHLAFHIRHNAKYPLASKWLKDTLLSHSLELRGPKGKCTLSQYDSMSTLVLLAGGTGYAPLRALLQDLLKTHTHQHNVYLYWGVCRIEDAYDLDQLREWEKTFPLLKVTLVLLEKMGWVHEYCARDHHSFENHTVFASGPFEMIKAAVNALTLKGLRLSHFKTDVDVLPAKIVQAAV